MRKTKFASAVKSLLTAGTLCLGMLAGSQAAQAYEIKTVFKSEHYAVNQAVLGEGENLDGPTQSAITGEIQTQNRLDKLYQSTTVIFPAGSPGYTGKINTPILGVLTIANFNTGKDRIYFNNKARFSSEGGLYISYKQLMDMLNQKTLNELIGELRKLPVVLTNIPVSSTGFDPTTSSFFITSMNKGMLLDMRIDDSVFYDKKTIRTARKGCTVNVLLFIDRMIDEIPYFISGRAALNNLDCSRAPAVKQESK
ncbi:hypothetical protein [Anaerobiospirillum sp. NML120449]|uniref:hypothetical protein n=1 Tax=Anaerobiospirillum sp. NML120449 TaxID=2932817 RepID=UPI001FF13BB1|nr:hypothetical protein [Anaerobiospirillum sp. NML120449]MCK0525975.1 hypothetical protein [Anaerobiospirillum sp. NML120449]